MNGSARKAPITSYFRSRILAWYSVNARTFPWRVTTNPFNLLMAEVLLQRTQAPQVDEYYDRILRRFPEPASLAIASMEEIGEEIKPLGLAKRVPLLKRLGMDLVARYGGQVPQNASQLASLPGVGRYAAAATAAFAYGQPLGVVDANVIRVFSRFFGVSSKRRRPRDDPRIWEFAENLVPRRRARDFNRALIDFASLVCRPRAPICGACPVRRKCVWFKAREEAR